MKRGTKTLLLSLLILISLLSLTIFSSIRVNAAIPKARIGHSMIYDSVNDIIIMYGGKTAAGEFLFDTWTYNCTSNKWISLSTENTPFGSYNTKMVYDSESEKIVSFGGMRSKTVASNQTWTFDYSEKEWTRVFPPTAPSARSEHNMVYDSISDRVILFGGALGSVFHNDTWSFNCNSNVWSNMKPKTYPLATRDFNFAFDSQNNTAVMFGGISSTVWGNVQTQVYSSDTWWYRIDSNIWENATPSEGPWGRASSAWVYDSRNEVCIMFGGSTPLDDSVGDDTLWYRVSSNTWTEANSESIFDRVSHEMVYSPIANRVILFGGASPGNTSQHYNDVWAYNYESNSWSKLETVASSFSLSVFIISLELIAVILLLKRKYKKK